MKAVVYHADAQFAWGGSPMDTYQRLFKGFRAQCHKYGLPLVHLTCNGMEGWGDENHFFDLDPANVVLNREIAFCEYLKIATDEVWLCEPDCRILKMFPSTRADCTLLLRLHDDVKICPAWRLAKPSALPLLEEFRDEAKKNRPDWHGDSKAFTDMWVRLGRPEKSMAYKGIGIEFRQYSDYIKPGVFTQNYMGNHKAELMEAWAV